MNQNLYTQIRTILEKYEFNDDANFYKLFKFAKHSGLRDVSFHTFTKHAKAMGVSSSVSRINNVPTRSLKYDPKADKYLKTVFPKYETCPNCKGSGVVRITFL